MEFKKRAQIVFGLLALLAAIIVAVVAIYESGYRISWRGIEKVGKGSISLFVDEQGADIIVDNKLFASAAAAGEIVELKGLEEGEHSIIVSKDGYWPWAKSLILPPDSQIRQSAFLVSENPKTTEISPESDLHKELSAKFALHFLPTANRPLIKISHDVAIYMSADGKTLTAFWRGDPATPPQHFCSAEECMSEYPAFSGPYDIESVIYLADRDDAVVISVGGGVYALELTPFEQKNFQPIYQGANPKIMERDMNSIFVQDGKRIFVVQF
jgi:hypothetical protein